MECGESGRKIGWRGKESNEQASDRPESGFEDGRKKEVERGREERLRAQQQ